MAEWINWYELCKTPLEEHFMREFYAFLDWEMVALHQTHISDQFIRDFSDLIDWEFLSMNPNLSDDIIAEYADEIHWRYVAHRPFSMDYLFEHRYAVDWTELSKHLPLTDEICELFEHFLDWHEIGNSRELSLTFIEKYFRHFETSERVRRIFQTATWIKSILEEQTRLPEAAIVNIIYFHM